MKNVSNGQRALWMVLITSLAAPFFASLIVVALRFVGPARRLHSAGETGAPIGRSAVDAFAWSALPATVAALGLSPFVLQHGTYTWLQAAVAGVHRLCGGRDHLPARRWQRSAFSRLYRRPSLDCYASRAHRRRRSPVRRETLTAGREGLWRSSVVTGC